MNCRKNGVGGRTASTPSLPLQTFVDVCRHRAEQTGGNTAFTHLRPGSLAPESLTYAELDRRICAIAAVLADRGRRGDRVLIVQDPGLEYITSLFACMYAGMVAVPVYPPDGLRLRHTLPRLQAITAEAGAKWMLSSRALLGESVGPLWAMCREGALATDEIDSSQADPFRPAGATASDIALLQYTSGSTGTPRGVTLRHQHLIANVIQGIAAFDVADAVAVMWLPPYHDMGLIGGILLPLFAGRHSVLMDPASFVQQPIRWLQAITQYGGTSTASPNFGYELCLRKIKPEDCDGLDLSKWQVAIAGAEPIRGDTMRRFSERFSPFGFPSSAFTPAYGMAEATLAITAKPLRTRAVTQRFLASALQGENARAVPCSEVTEEEAGQGKGTELVSCGLPVQGCEICIVDPDLQRKLPAGHVGEIWIRSPSIAEGYWRQPELSQQTFDIALHDSSGVLQTGFLRTGDMGFLHEGELFVSGRLKELIIIAGRNFFPHDIEAAIQSSHPAFRVDGGVAFGLDDGQQEKLVIVQEVLRPRKYHAENLVEWIRQTVFRDFGIAASTIVLVNTGSLPKTSSGKLRRLQCREMFLADELQDRQRWDAPEMPREATMQGATDRPAAENSSPLSESPESNHADQAIPVEPRDPVVSDEQTEWEQKLAPIWCEVLDLSNASADQHFLECGGHSLAATQLLSRIGEQLGIEADYGILAGAPRFDQLAKQLEQLHANNNRRVPAAADEKDYDPSRLPLTASQRRFWVLEQLDRYDAFLHVDLTLEITGDLDVERLAKRIQRIPLHHDAMRLRFGSDRQGQPFQTLCGAYPSTDILLPVERIDLSTLAEANRAPELQKIQSRLARQPFDLAQPPLARAALVQMDTAAFRLILVAHHMVCDGTSLLWLVEDVARRYATEDEETDLSTAIPLEKLDQHPSTSGDWLDALRWEHGSTQTAESGDQLEYWQQRLQRVPPNSALNVSTRPDPLWPCEESGPRGRKAVCHCHSSLESEASFSTCQCETADSTNDWPGSRTVRRRLDASLQDLLACRARQSSVTPFAIWLATWQLVLSRYCTTDDVVIGVPVAHRNHTRLERLVGCFIELVPFRVVPRDTRPPQFEDLLQQTHRLWLADFQNNGISFDSLVESLQIPRQADRLPLIQHLLLHQPAASLDCQLGSARCIDFESSYTTLGGYDTALAIEHHGETCQLVLAFNPDRLDAAIAENMIDALLATLREAMQTTDLSIGRLPLLAPQEQQRLADRSQCGPTASAGDTILQRFEQQVARVPHRPAVIDGKGALSFAELSDSSQQLACNLASAGVRPGDIVALHLGRSRHVVEAILAIWKLGAAYLPLDPSVPVARLLDLIHDGQPALLLDDGLAKAPAILSTAVPNRSLEALSQETVCFDRGQLTGPSPTSLAYLIYTSGSTGRPKGVMIEHQNVANLCAAFASDPGFSEGESLLAATSLSFDISVLELILPLTVGGTVSLIPKRIAEAPEAVVDWLHEHPVEVVQGTPSSLQMLLASGWRPAAGLRIWCGGEPLLPSLAQELIAHGAEVWNVYGPTETTVWSLVHRVDAIDGAFVSIGRPIGSTQITVVDAEGREVPEGVPGELWVAGEGVARGYLNRPELNRSRFVVTPKHGRVYRTGDMVRWHADGALEMIGRQDRQIKVRGHRVELGEIESTLVRHPQVLQAAVTTVAKGTADRGLVAFYRSAEAKPVSAENLRSFLAERLPLPMVPSAFVDLPSLPTTPAGKIDYNALPLPSAIPARTSIDRPRGAEARSPQTATEEALLAIWQEILGLESIGVHDRFFDLGGHSLMAARMVAHIQTKLGVSLRLRDAYQQATIAELASWIDERRSWEAMQLSAPPDPLLEFVRRERECGTSLSTRDVPLSPSEQRLWFVDQLEPSHPFYNLPLAAKIEGPLELGCLTESLNECVARHETLRSSYHMVDGEPKRRVTEQLRITPMIVDLSSETEGDRALTELLRQEARRPFELEHGPLLRALFVRLAESEHVVLLVMHHIISDGWSMGVMMQELAEFYRARRAGDTVATSPLQIRFGEYAQWQAANAESDAVSSQLEYWTQKLGNATETLDLPTDFPRPPVQDFEGATLPVTLSPQLSAGIDRLAARLQVTPFAVLMAAYSLLLRRLAQQQDLTVGTVVANRSHPATERLIGFFANTLALPHHLEDTCRFDRWVADVHEAATEAFAHQDLPFEQVVARLAGERDRSHSPLFQAAFVLQNAPHSLQSTDDLTLTQLDVDNGTAKYDLTLLLTPEDGCYRGRFEYRSGLFRSESINAFQQSFACLLRAAIADPGSELRRLSLVSPAQRARIERHGQGPLVEDIPHRLNAWLADSLQRNSERIAVCHGTQQLSFGQLDRRASQIADGLQRQGIQTADAVVVYMRRSIDQVASLLAVIRLGGIFVPVDGHTPLARLHTIATEVAAKVVIAEPGNWSESDWQESDGPKETKWFSAAALADAGSRPTDLPDVDPDAPAYLIFTSGSTGLPKGVTVSHRAFCNFLRGWLSIIPLDEHDACPHIFSPSFDGALAEIFTTLLSGARLEIVDRETVVDPRRFAQFARDRGLTFASLTPPMLGSLRPEDFAGVSRILSAGAALTPELARRWLPTHELFNGYGPTECAVGAAMHRISQIGPSYLPVGRPLANMRLYVLDEEMQVVPEMVSGEVYIGGASVGLGYWNDPRQTEQRFIADPFCHDGQARMYRTGDLGRWNRDGLLEIIGRADDQVKLRGFRVEPGEVAAVLDRLPVIKQSAVVVQDAHPGTAASQRLVAYYVAEDASDIDALPQRSTATEEATLEEQHLDNWLALFGESHRDADLVHPPEDNFSGWSSVITGGAIPLPEMRAWAEETAQRIIQLGAKNILEIGCGTGLIFFRIAAGLDRYVGLDLMPAAIAEFRRSLQRDPEQAAKTTLFEGPADQLDDLPSQSFDCIVLNSVVQYFPSRKYLLRVLHKAESLLAPGGRIFLGDLRNLRLHAALATAAELARTDDEALSVGQLRRRIRSRMEHDEELLVDPGLQTHLQPHLSRLREVKTELKTGPYDNELSRFRFDAVLHFDKQSDAISRPHFALPQARARNARVYREWAIWERLQAAEAETDAKTVINAVDRDAAPCIDPSSLVQQARAAGHRLQVDWDPLHPAQITLSTDGAAESQREELSAWLGQAFVDNVRSVEGGDPARQADAAPPSSLASEADWSNHPLHRRYESRLARRMRDHLSAILPEFMIPAAFVRLDELPLTLQGKLDKSALPPPPAARPEWAGPLAGPTTAEETLLAEVWEELLEISPIGIDDDFFQLGGHSMLAMRMVAEIERRAELRLPLFALFQQPTIRHLAKVLTDPATSSAATSVVPLNTTNEGSPIFCIHPAGGTVFCYRELAERLAGRHPVFGIQARGVDGREKPHQSLVEMAAYYARAIRAAVPSGPIHLLGWSLGGNIAYEVARQLRESGSDVGIVTLLDAGRLTDTDEVSEEDFLPLIAALFPEDDQHRSLEHLRQQSPQSQLEYFLRQAAKADIVPQDQSWIGMHIFDVFQANVKAVHRHQALPWDGDLTLIRPEDQQRTGVLFDDPTLGWQDLVSEVKLCEVSGDHAHMLQAPAVDEVAELLSDWLQEEATKPDVGKTIAARRS